MGDVTPCTKRISLEWRKDTWQYVRSRGNSAKRLDRHDGKEKTPGDVKFAVWKVCLPLSIRRVQEGQFVRSHSPRE